MSDTKKKEGAFIPKANIENPPEITGFPVGPEETRRLDEAAKKAAEDVQFLSGPTPVTYDEAMKFGLLELAVKRIDELDLPREVVKHLLEWNKVYVGAIITMSQGEFKKFLLIDEAKQALLESVESMAATCRGPQEFGEKWGEATTDRWVGLEFDEQMANAFDHILNNGRSLYDTLHENWLLDSGMAEKVREIPEEPTRQPELVFGYTQRQINRILNNAKAKFKNLEKEKIFLTALIEAPNAANQFLEAPIDLSLVEERLRVVEAMLLVKPQDGRTGNDSVFRLTAHSSALKGLELFCEELLEYGTHGKPLNTSTLK